MEFKNILYFALEVWGCIFCAISGAGVYISQNIGRKDNRALLYLLITNAFLLLFDSFAWLFRGHEGNVGYFIVVVSNFMVFLLSYVILFAFTFYLKTVVELRANISTKLVYITYLCAAIGIVLIIISQFTDLYYYYDEHNFYHRAKYFPISQIWGIVGSIVDCGIVVKYRKYLTRNDKFKFVSYLLLPAIAVVAQTFIYGFSLLNIAYTLSILLMFLISQMEQANMIVEQGKMITKSSIDVALSQIQPHFLYNCLNTIRYLCKHNTEEAENAINDFSDYLRGNMAGLSNQECITFAKELKHTKSYISLEKKRFGKRLNVEYDIEEIGFMLPALSLQPIVENSIKYGLMQNINGVNVKISTKLDKNNYIVEVSDDGLGFDIEHIYDDNKTHIGIANVRKKLELMCNGKLEIDSKVGVGTTAKIIISK